MSDSALEQEQRRRQERQRIQRQLDDALAASFPASDPVSIVTSHAEEDWGDDTAPTVPDTSAGAETPGRD